MPDWKQLGEEILSWFLHPNCPLCGRSAQSVLCDNCDRQLNQYQWSNPKFLDRRLRLPEGEAPAATVGQGNLSVFTWGQYSGLLKRAIASLKYEHQPQLARPLGERLGQTWLKASAFPASGKPLVVPIPLHPEKQKQRGYNQAELIARAFCETTRLPLQPQGLKRIKPTEALFGLSPKQGENQVADAFVIGKGFNSQGKIMLLDDIYTTGATVNAARITLQKAGFQVIGVCAIAKPKTR